MKAVIVTYTPDGTIQDSMVVPDSAITRCKDPFFLPDNRSWRCMHLYGVRIDRLGKDVAEKFAPLYYNQLVTASLQRACEPADPAYLQCARDGALIVSDPADKPTDCPAYPLINATIHTISHEMTLKTGDLVLIAPTAGKDNDKNYTEITENPVNIEIFAPEGFPPLTVKIR